MHGNIPCYWKFQQMINFFAKVIYKLCTPNATTSNCKNIIMKWKVHELFVMKSFGMIAIIYKESQKKIVFVLYIFIHIWILWMKRNIRLNT